MAKSSKKKLREAVARTKRMFKVIYTYSCDNCHYVHIEN